MSDKAKQLLEFAYKNDGITTAQAVDLIGHHYYHNATKYVSEMLGRLVKSKHLERIKPGHFKIGKAKIEITDPSQISLF